MLSFYFLFNVDEAAHGNEEKVLFVVLKLLTFRPNQKLTKNGDQKSTQARHVRVHPWLK
jgi:hypothetical protein